MATNNPGSSNAIAGAITFPTNNDNSQLQPLEEQPRQPRTLQGLLRFAMEATKAEDAPGNSQLGPMDEERRRFLDEALNAHTIRVDEILKKNITILTDTEKISSIQAGDELPHYILIAFQELGEYIEDIDVANDFEKMGGFRIFPLCYSSDNVELHRWANLTLAQVCQNNPRCQERALRCCLLPVLLHRLRDHQPEDRSLRALSSMIRNYEPGTRALVAQGGCEVLAETLRHAEHSELASAAFLVTYLCRHSSDARDIFIRNNTIQSIVEILRASRTDASEYLLNILVTLLETQPGDVVPLYRDPGLDLKRTLEDHLQIQDVKNGRFIEEKEHCEKILSFVFIERERNRRSETNLQDVEPADR